MPTARESLLEAAHAAVTAQPWPTVRMVKVASSAGVSRQTLYNEFGSKEGLGVALVAKCAEGLLRGVARTAEGEVRKSRDVAHGCAVASAWLLRTARRDPLARAVLTGCQSARTPPAPRGHPVRPHEMASRLCDRLVTGAPQACEDPDNPDDLRRACEVGIRLALSYLLASAGVAEYRADGEVRERVEEVVRAMLRKR